VPPNSLVLYEGGDIRVVNKKERDPAEPDYQI
jgi:hypothetical protein